MNTSIPWPASFDSPRPDIPTRRGLLRWLAAILLVSLVALGAAGSGQAEPSLQESDWQNFPLYGGEMTSIARHPSNPLVVYVGSRGAGVFKTSDGGVTWLPARSGLTFAPIRSLAVDPSHPDTVYAGTDFSGVWKTTDGGVHWAQTGAQIDYAYLIERILIDPTQPNTLYAAAARWGSYTGHVYKSVDGGASWQTADIGLPSRNGYTNIISALAMDPSNPAHLVAGTAFDGIFVTTNGGQSWTAMNTGLPKSGEDYYTVTGLAFDPQHANRPSAIFNEIYYGVYYVYEANQWRQVSLANGGPGSGVYRNDLYYSPTNPDLVLAAGDLGCAKSLDGGQNWLSCRVFSSMASETHITFDPLAPNTLYAVTTAYTTSQRGVFKSTDQGQTWTDIANGIPALKIDATAIDPNNSQAVYASDDQGYFYRSLDGGNTWTSSSPQHHHIRDIAVDPQDGRNIYLSGLNLLRSADQGENFYVQPVSMPYRIVAAPAPAAAIYVSTIGSRGLYKSADGGQTWQPKNTGLPQSSLCGGLCQVSSLAVDPSRPATVYAGGDTINGGVIKTVDGGEHWQVVGMTDPVKTKYIHAIAVHPHDSNQVLIAANYNSRGQIYKSTNGGSTWLVKLDDPGAAITDFVYDPRDAQVVYASTEGLGILRSQDGGETWRSYSPGFFFPLSYSLSISQDEQPLLVAGSFSAGLWWKRPPLDALPPPLMKIYLPLLVK